MAWTDEQQLVIDTRNKNMLVSAAAGSGKTAVLVQRIISKILDEKNPVDVDKILVVTFTTAAAGEMKERVRKAIENACLTNPNRADLRKQSTLIHNAQIRTIDSFCSWVVKNYFYEIDQEPSFRIGTKGELDMLKDEVISNLIGERFESQDEEFLKFADAYVDGKNISSIKTKVYDIYDKAMSYPWPMEWYEQILDLYNVCSVEELAKSEFVVSCFEKAVQAFSRCYEMTKRALAMYDSDVDSKDKNVLLNENVLYENAMHAQSFGELVELVSGVKFETFRPSAKSVPNEDELLRVKELRNASKDAFLKIKADYLSQTFDEVFEDLKYVRNQAKALVSLAVDYTNALSQVKRKRNIFDFNDIEHMALEILRNPESKEHEKRPVAIELSNFFEEVMVDEYQDSNDLQEWILTAVSREDNYFTVGDVKQSIYAFRQASPALFMDKFNTYVKEDTVNSIRIDLDKNFRSRKEVLDFCNDVFRPLMGEDMGKVKYDKAAELKVGATYYPINPMGNDAEILIANADKAEIVEAGLESKTFEAQMVADRIKKLIAEGYLVTDDDPEDKDKKILRPIKYSDIVILIRSTKSNGQSYARTLMDSGVPAYVEEETGFFERDEIQTLLSMLEVIDNPYNDIPLAAVLHSPMFGFDSDELAKIRCFDTSLPFYQCFFDYAKANEDDIKVNSFVTFLSKLRKEMVDTPIHEMLRMILDETKYGLYVKALPMGDVAYANINKLMDEAISFEGTSYQGLSRFVSYVNDLKTYDEELGLAKTVSESDDAVRIMTIHKSKGLEFPVVFLCRAGSRFATGKDSFMYHPSIGFGMNYKNPDTRIGHNTLFANVIKDRIKADSLGEEQRILYVALTRAKEKLIITGAIAPTKDSSVEDIVASMCEEDEILSYETKEQSASYLEWILRAVSASKAKVTKKIVGCADLIVDEVSEQVTKKIARDCLTDLYNKADVSIGKDLVDAINFEYENETNEEYKNKYSVSEIKHQAMEDAFNFSEDAKPAFLYEEKEAYIPSFAKGDVVASEDESSGEMRGALYGTAMHRFMECFDFSRDDYANSFDDQFSVMQKTGELSLEQKGLVRRKKLVKFLETDLANRMHKADQEGRLYKEQPFVFGALPEDLFSEDEFLAGKRNLDENTGEMILVQGIIDVYFKEDDGIVLLDYKTDRVDDDSELVLRYEKQLRLYQNAIERALSIKVKDVLIYSFSLDKVISIGV